MWLSILGFGLVTEDDTVPYQNFRSRYWLLSRSSKTIVWTLSHSFDKNCSVYWRFWSDSSYKLRSRRRRIVVKSLIFKFQVPYYYYLIINKSLIINWHGGFILGLPVCHVCVSITAEPSSRYFISED